jgi:Thioesterase-like superfamily
VDERGPRAGRGRADVDVRPCRNWRRFRQPFANAGDQGLGYINSDVTLYLHRLPVTRWIGFDVVNHHASDGIAIGECWLYDEKGPIGTSTVAALAQRKPMTNVPPP